MSLLSLLKKTEAYSVIKKEKESGALSHAYLAVCKDGEFLTEYLKLLASLIVCKENEPCKTCRNCSLISSNIHTDVLVYPKEGDSVKVEDIEDLIEQSYIKPLEIEKKVFIITHAEKMNAQSQNKLLKTLEEPPKNVVILMGATSEYGLLPTVLSRLKRLSIRDFSEGELLEYFNSPNARFAVSMCDGTVGDAKRLMQDEGFLAVQEFALSVMLEMKSSKEVLDYSTRITDLKKDFSLILSVLEILYRDLLMVVLGRKEFVKNKQYLERLSKAEGYKEGAVIGILEMINGARARMKFNANQTMLQEWVLFQILEEKYKWQKL